MTNVRIYQALNYDARVLAREIRPDDLRELQAATDLPVYDVVMEGIAAGPAWSCYVNSELLAVWGVVPKPPTTLCLPSGWGWLLTTNLVEKHRKLFWDLTKQLLWDLLRYWHTLENFIDVRYEKALRWGKYLGFQFDPPEPFGVSGLPAQHFVVSREMLKCVPHL